jgi:hypothetical protein
MWRKSSYSSNGGDCVEIGVVDLNPPVSGWRTSSYSGNNGECVEIGVMDVSPATDTWCKSSRSNGGEACVEVGMADLSPAADVWHESSHTSNGGGSVKFSVMTDGHALDDSTANVVRLLAVRDSKDPAGPRLHFPPSAWNTFAHDIKNGAYGNLG